MFSACGQTISVDIPEGKVLLEEFSDLQCPACKGAHPLVKELQDNFGDDLIIRFVHFPLEQIHENAFHAAEAAECVRDQDNTNEIKFWAFVEAAYANQSSLNDETFVGIAQNLGLDTDVFQACLTSGEKSALVRKDMAIGRKRRVNATPTFFLNGEKVEDRKYEVLVKQIDQLLAKESTE